MTNSTVPSPLPSPSGQADGLYGPGTMVGWYLTLLACTISWLRPTDRKRKDSLDPDLVIALLLPLGATTHLISLTHQLATQLPVHDTDTRDSVIHILRAMRAPLIVLFAFTHVSTVLLLPLASSPRRLAVIAFVAVACCWTARLYLNYTQFNDRALSLQEHVSFIHENDMLVRGIFAGIGSESVTVFWHSLMWVLGRSGKATSMTGGEMRTVRNTLVRVNLMAVLFAWWGRKEGQGWTGTHWLCPVRNSRWDDLDQMIALGSGMVLLVFHLCGTARCWVQKWWEGQTETRADVEGNTEMHPVLGGGRKSKENTPTDGELIDLDEDTAVPTHVP